MLDLATPLSHWPLTFYAICSGTCCLASLPCTDAASRNIHEGGPLLSCQLKKQKLFEPHPLLTKGWASLSELCLSPQTLLTSPDHHHHYPPLRDQFFHGLCDGAESSHCLCSRVSDLPGIFLASPPPRHKTNRMWKSLTFINFITWKFLVKAKGARRSTLERGLLRR